MLSLEIFLCYLGTPRQKRNNSLHIFSHVGDDHTVLDMLIHCE